MKTVVVNMTRFGDLIQGQAAVRGLAGAGPVELVCLENFAPAAKLLDRVDAVHALPGAGLLADIDRGWTSGLGRLAGFVDAVRASGPADLVVNLTPSLPARLLASRLGREPGTPVRGFVMDAHGFNADTSAWAAFLQMASGNRGASPFNVIDLFTRVAGVRPKDTDPALARPGRAVLDAARDRLPDPAEAHARGWAGFQLGASEDQRRWPVERFAEVARGLWEEAGLVPALLGSKGESPLGERFLGRLDEPLAGLAVNLMGRTNLSELAGVVTRLALLVTNDTGTMHLAAGLGVPCAAVFLATAQPFDTGPCLPGSVCFEPDMDCHPCAFGRTCDQDHACRLAVPADTVLAHALALVNVKGAGPDNGPGARVWRTLRDQDGFLDLESLSGHEATDRVRWIRIQRGAYRRFLDDEASQAPAGPHGLSPEVAAGLRSSLGGARDALFLLRQQAKLLLTTPREPLKRKFLASWQRAEALLRADSRLEVLASLWRFQSQAAGGDLPGVIALTERYLDLLDSLLALFPADGTEFE